MSAKTIEILEAAADEVRRHCHQYDPELRQWYTRMNTLHQRLFEQQQENPTLRRQVLELLDAQGTVSDLEQKLYFRLGLQMGLELGALDRFPPK